MIVASATFACNNLPMRARIWNFRIFTAKQYYRGAGSIILDRNFAVKDSSTLRVTIGKIPQEITFAHSTTNPVLEMFLSRGSSVSPRPLPASWTTKGELYTSILIAREVEIAEDPENASFDYFWYDWREADAFLQSFGESARTALDVATGRLVELIGVDLIDGMLHDSRTFIEAAGKPVQPLPVLRFGNPRVVTMRPKGELQIKEVENLGSSMSGDTALVESVGRWYALALGESDPFKQFMWAFAGLEVIVTKTAKRWRNEVLEVLGSGGAVDQTIAAELLWPNAGDDSKDPWRNLAFKFALMALALSSVTAKSDVAEFKQIQSFRNKIHGQYIDEALVSSKASAALGLLRKYAPLAARVR